MKHFILSVIALIFFVFEGFFAQFFANFGDHVLLIPRFMAVFLFFVTIYGSRKYGMIYGAILGLGYDVVYTEILGVYMFLLPFLAYLLSKLMRVLHMNLWVVCLVSLFFVGVIELVSYEINVVLSFTAMNFGEFLTSRLLPTLLLNFVFILLFCYPLKRLMERLDLRREAE
ncbi:rod shape-determining protein MreD [Bacillus massiliglaciei]|uniref:rod shape-determining protein MreD n=1 Tax=Bacillus massiliglaciei TaxID=1816693 RepID=UPI000DA5FEEC|nr:rod shape-determining protein MreD [Bacillus massiliglaciei]